VELTASVDEGGVKIDGTEDQWFLQVRWPCRKYRVQIKIAEGLALQLALPRAFVRLATREGEELHEVGEETQRFSSGIGKRLADTHTLTAQVDYPLPGMFYELYWKCWARDRILPPT
jgi:hypothetical protein